LANILEEEELQEKDNNLANQKKNTFKNKD
jgi:hypothetical protein